MRKRLILSLTATLAVVIARPFVSSDTSAQDSFDKDRSGFSAAVVSNENTSKPEAEPKAEKISDLATRRSACLTNVLRQWREVKAKRDAGGTASEADERQVKDEYFAQRELNEVCSALEKLIESHPNTSVSKRAEKALRELSDAGE